MPDMNTATLEALAPCPFCGGERIELHHIRDGRAIGCRDCGASLRAYLGTVGLREQLHAAWNRRADAPQAIAQAAQIKLLREALAEGRRAIGDHQAPDDCYATGPLTGDTYRDLIQCPACSFIALYDALQSEVGNG